MLSHVRAANLDDAPALLRLAGALAARAPGHPGHAAHELGESPHRRTLVSLLALEDARLIVADRDGRAVGYLLGFAQLTLYANGPLAWVQELVVEEAYRREGLGRRLMEDFEAWARGRRAVLVALATRRATAFYEALGYSESAAYYKKYL